MYFQSLTKGVSLTLKYFRNKMICVTRRKGYRIELSSSGLNTKQFIWSKLNLGTVTTLAIGLVPALVIQDLAVHVRDEFGHVE